jgi:autotransporter-associated beta strand protein
MRVLNNGTFTSTDTTLGILMCRTNGANANNVASATFTGGVSTLERFTLGFDSTVTAGSATIAVNGGTLYIGSGGIVKNGAAGLGTNLNFGSGVVGAKADWSTSLPINLPNGGNVNLKSSDAADAAHDIALNGVLSGAGGFTKIGGGRLVLGAANTFTGAIAVNAGTLSVDGSLGAGAMAVNSGGTLTGSGTINRSVVLNSGGTLRPGTILNAASLVWSGGGMISYNLGASSNQLALTGALTKGGAGPYNFVFTPGAGFADGNTYTLVTFGSTDFTADDFTFSGLPDGFSGIFTVTANSVTFTALVPPSIVTQPQNETVLLGGIARFSVVASGSPVLRYQWFRNSILIPGATDSVLTINNVQGANIGSYTVTVTNAVGGVTSNSARLLIAAVSLVNHAPNLNSARVEGSLQLMRGESLALNGSTSVSGDLLVPGTPSVVVNGSPSYVGTVDDGGSTSPSNYSVTLNSNVSLEHVIRRTDPVSLPVVNAPVSPTGSRSVTINNPNQSVGDWATVRNLTLNSNAGRIAVPAGAYGDFTANSGTGFTLGVAGASEAAVYYFQHLMLNSEAVVDVVGPVIVLVANGFSVSGGSVGNPGNPAWLTLGVYAGVLSLNSGASVYGYVSLPNGMLTIGGNCQAVGVVAADSLTINKDGRLLMAELN